MERERKRERELEIGSHKTRMQTDSLDKSSIREQVSTGLEFVLYKKKTTINPLCPAPSARPTPDTFLHVLRE